MKIKKRVEMFDGAPFVVITTKIYGEVIHDVFSCSRVGAVLSTGDQDSDNELIEGIMARHL